VQLSVVAGSTESAPAPRLPSWRTRRRPSPPHNPLPDARVSGGRSAAPALAGAGGRLGRDPLAPMQEARPMAITLHEQLAQALRPALQPAPEPDRAPPPHHHPADVADALRDLDPEEAVAVFGYLQNGQAAELLDELAPELTRYLIEHAPAGLI